MSNLEDEFSKFLDVAEEQTAIDSELRATTERFWSFLDERGVSDTPFTQVNVRFLASVKMMIEEVMLLKPDEPSLYEHKKRLQAQYLIKDADEAWQQLIDQEFPGEPLNENDVDIIASQFSDGLEVSEELQKQDEETEKAMLNHLLIQEGITPGDLGETEQETLDFLKFMYNITRIKPQDKFERVRDFLIETGQLEHPAWNSLLYKFFTPGERG